MRILALDAGTSSVKAVLAERVDDCWRLIGTGLAPLEAPSSDIRGGAEQDPEAWWAASCAAITQLGVVDCDAVALSGQMQSVLPVGANGRTVVRHALLYCDARAEVEAAEVVARLGKERLHAECSNFKGAVSVLPKMLWLLRHEPEALDTCMHVALSSHDYVFLRATGACVTDVTNASTTGMLSCAMSQDSRGCEWATDLLRDAGVPTAVISKLPSIPICAGAAGTIAMMRLMSTSR